MLALEFLHSRRTVFRDVKPENVLTVSAGDPNVALAKLADFGLACCVDPVDLQDLAKHDSRGAPAGITQVVGTPAFMPPEAHELAFLESSREQNMRMLASRDWYALGCCLMLMLLGERGASRTLAQRRVLLPLPLWEMRATLCEAMDGGHGELDALRLAMDLTRDNPTERAGVEEVRGSTFLQD